MPVQRERERERVYVYGEYTTRRSPFLSLDDAPDAYEWVKMFILSPVCVLRVLVVVAHLIGFWMLASLKLVGMKAAAIRGSQPMPWWRNFLFGGALRALIASCLLSGGVWMTVKGKKNLREAQQVKEVVAVFNHVSFLDPFVLLRLTAVTGVAKAGIDDLPLIGQVGKALQVVFVARKGTVEGSSTSRRGGTIQLMRERLERAAHFPLLALAPEGTTHNGQSVIKFQTGAFALGRPVLPILLRYPYAHFNPAWTLTDTAWLLIRLFSQVYTRAEVEVMPLRYPSMEEEKNPSLFGHNVQREMAAALGVPAVEQDMYDAHAMMKAGFSVNVRGRVTKVDVKTAKRQAWL